MKPRTRHRLLTTAAVATALAGLLAYASEHRWSASTGDREALAQSRLSIADGASRAPLRGGIAHPGASTARPARVGPLPSLEQKMYSEPASRRALAPAQRSPYYAAPDSLRLRYGDPARADALARPSQRLFLAEAARRGAGGKALGVCNANDFRILSGTALVDYIKSISPDCIHQTLFSITGTAAAETFSEAKMTTVANAIRTASQAYAGNNSGGIIQLVTFMRAGYYVNFYDDSVPAYSTALTGTVKAALDPFFAKSPWLQVNDANAEVLSEILVLADSSENQHSYLWVAKEMMAAFGDAHAANRFMSNAMINVFNLLFRGQWNDAYKAAVRADNSIVDATYNFTIRNWSRLGTANAYHTTNAARELTRFVSQWDYPNTTVETLARARLKDLITRAYGSGIGSSPNLTVSAPTYGLLVSGVDYYDRDGCTPYGTCNAAQQVETAVLTLRHTCPNNANYRIRAMNLTATQLTTACNLVVGQEAYFHNKFGTAGRPVANDNNTTLEINVFDNSTAYGDWAGIIFGIDTNNGGMYLEGDPSVAGNQARFVAYEASDGSIWNLTHEFVHYLDGRYNKYGGFKSDGKLVWWVEGIAEYISYGYENKPNTWALDLAGSRAYTLSTLFDTSYSHGQDRIYA
jgi:microbial collagenase